MALQVYCITAETAKNFGLQEENINISKPQGWRKRDGVPQKERERERDMDRKREKRGMQCYMEKEDNSLIDVENVKTPGERCRI